MLDWLLSSFTVSISLCFPVVALTYFPGVAVHVLGSPTPQPDAPPQTERSELHSRTSWTDVNENIIVAQRVHVVSTPFVF